MLSSVYNAGSTYSTEKLLMFTDGTTVMDVIITDSGEKRLYQKEVDHLTS